MSEDLSARRLQLDLLRAACLLASEGTSRASSSEVLFRARKEFGTEALASAAGQALGFLGLPSSTSKGKTRFLLDAASLEPLIEELSYQLEAMEARADRLIRSFGDLDAQLAPLEERYHQALRQAQRLEEMRRFVQEHRSLSQEDHMLHFEYQRVREAADRLQQLRTQIKATEESLASLPELEQRKSELEPRAREASQRKAELDQAEKALAQREKQLDLQSSQLNLRSRYVTVTSLDREIAQKQAQLATLNSEIDKRRSFLDRLLGRNNGEENV